MPNDSLAWQAGRQAGEVLSRHERLVSPDKETVAADHYIIALARIIIGGLSKGMAVIVTEEGDRASKIPRVARHCGIRSVNVAGFLDEIGHDD